MIKLFEQFNNEQEIHDICKKYNIKNYTINPDGSIDVDGDVRLSEKSLEKLPLKFNKVGGSFKCSTNKLISLIGGPKEVGGDFDCHHNRLTTLKGGPIFIGGSYDCSKNNLTTLEGCVDRINHDFYCDKNNITSLKDGPIVVGVFFSLFECPISIIDTSIEIKGDIYIDDTNFDDKIKLLSQDKLRILFEHGVDYDIFRKDGSINDKRLERLFKDFNI